MRYFTLFFFFILCLPNLVCFSMLTSHLSLDQLHFKRSQLHMSCDHQMGQCTSKACLSSVNRSSQFRKVQCSYFLTAEYSFDAVLNSVCPYKEKSITAVLYRSQQCVETCRIRLWQKWGCSLAGLGDPQQFWLIIYTPQCPEVTQKHHSTE